LFRPAYRNLQGLKQQMGDVPVLALTATATRRVAGDIIRQLGMRKPSGFKGSFFRSNLRITAQRKGARVGIESLVAKAPLGSLGTRRGAGGSRSTGGTAELDTAGQEVFEKLRALRRRLADAEGVPAYIVFSDAVLRSMALMRPRYLEQLLLVPGVGPVKLERYGAAFLEVIAESE
jgi:superfamily II DNA helicase RecQ